MAQARFGDRLAALNAVAEVAGVDPPKGGVNCGTLHLSTPLLRDGHGLDLHGVNPRKAAHAILFQNDRGSISF